MGWGGLRAPGTTMAPCGTLSLRPRRGSLGCKSAGFLFSLGLRGPRAGRAGCCAGCSQAPWSPPPAPIHLPGMRVGASLLPTPAPRPETGKVLPLSLTLGITEPLEDDVRPCRERVIYLDQGTWGLSASAAHPHTCPALRLLAAQGSRPGPAGPTSPVLGVPPHGPRGRSSMPFSPVRSPV